MSRKPKRRGAPRKGTRGTPKKARASQKGPPAADLKPEPPAESAQTASKNISIAAFPAVFEGSDAQKARALVKYRELGTVRSACEAAGIGRRTWYNWVEEDRQFAALVDEAKEDVADELEETAAMRAKAADGSDLLLIFLLKALRPSRFRENIKIDLVSPVVRDKVRQTVSLIRSSLDPALADPLLKKLSEVWK